MRGVNSCKLCFSRTAHCQAPTQKAPRPDTRAPGTRQRPPGPDTESAEPHTKSAGTRHRDSRGRHRERWALTQRPRPDTALGEDRRAPTQTASSCDLRATHPTARPLHQPSSDPIIRLACDHCLIRVLPAGSVPFIPRRATHPRATHPAAGLQL